MTTVTRADLRTARICGAGARGWWQRRGLCWQTFLREGIDAETLRAGGHDELVERVIAAAADREGR